MRCTIRRLRLLNPVHYTTNFDIVLACVLTFDIHRYFQCGVSNFLLGRYEFAFKDFEEALLYLRGNQAINYEQLGLQFRLYSAEVLFNKGLCHIYMGASRSYELKHRLIDRLLRK